MNSRRLLGIAKALADGQIGGRRGRPNQEELRKALSTAYYALFDALASAAADAFVGSSSTVRKSHLWVQTYRSLDHGAAKTQCSKVMTRQYAPAFSSTILTFADSLVTMQGLRLDADYNPGRTFYRSGVQMQVTAAEQALEGFLNTPRADRKAFAAFVMHRGRGS